MTHRNKTAIRIITILLLVLCMLWLSSCSKTYHEFVKVTIDQGGESVMLRGYLEQPKSDPHLYMVEVMECGQWVTREVLIPAGEVYAEYHYQTNCKVGEMRIVYDDILRR